MTKRRVQGGDVIAMAPRVKILATPAGSRIRSLGGFPGYPTVQRIAGNAEKPGRERRTSAQRGCMTGTRAQPNTTYPDMSRADEHRYEIAHTGRVLVKSIQCLRPGFGGEI